MDISTSYSVITECYTILNANAMSNPLSGWRIISRKDLHEMARPVPYSQSTEKRVKDAKFEYWNIYKNCTSEVQKRKELERISEKYNIREDVILEFVDRQLKYGR